MQTGKVEFTPDSGSALNKTRVEQEDCYCVCHTPLASRPSCEHCKGDNPVVKRYREHAHLKDAVVEAAKLFTANGPRDNWDNYETTFELVREYDRAEGQLIEVLKDVGLFRALSEVQVER